MAFAKYFSNHIIIGACNICFQLWREKIMNRLIFLITVLFLAGISNYGLCEIYKWTSEEGSIGFTDTIGKVPEKYRNQLKTIKKPKLINSEKESTTEHSQEEIKQFDVEQLPTVDLYPGSQIDDELKNKWRSMSDYLRSGNTEQALELIHPRMRSDYKQMFQALGSQLPHIVSQEVEIQFRKIVTQTYVQYELITIENGEKYSYDVFFIRDFEGTWWIYEY
jgi:hypothetical protein